MADITVGAFVHLKPKTLERLGMSERILQGGEGTVVSMMEDAKGLVFSIKLNRSGRVRMARSEDLVVHKKGRKDEDRVRLQTRRPR